MTSYYAQRAGSHIPLCTCAGFPAASSPAPARSQPTRRSRSPASALPVFNIVHLLPCKAHLQDQEILPVASPVDASPKGPVIRPIAVGRPAMKSDMSPRAARGNRNEHGSRACGIPHTIKSQSPCCYHFHRFPNCTLQQAPRGIAKSQLALEQVSHRTPSQ